MSGYVSTALRVAKSVPPQPLTGRTPGAPTVSVVIPCYNYGRYLGACVDSVLAQAHVTVDILIVDDASPDGSGDVADALAAAHPAVSTIRHAQNKGHIATYNEGLALAEGKYVVLLSADDLLTPGALGRSVALLEAHPAVGLAYGHPVLFQDNPPMTRTEPRSWSIWPGQWWIAERCRRGANCIHSPEVVMRTSVQRQIGGYRTELPHSGDLEMWLRAARISDVGHVNGTDQALRRIHATNMSQTTFAGCLPDMRERIRAFDTFFRGPGAALDDAPHLLGAARRNIAAAVVDTACAIASQPGESPEDVEDLIRFAAETSPDMTSLRQWRELRWHLEHPHRSNGQSARRSWYWRRRHLQAHLDKTVWSWRGV